MTQKVNPIPAGYHTVTPYLMVKGADKALDFYQKAFNAKEILRVKNPQGKVCHAEIQIGDSRLMLADEYPEMSMNGPITIGGTPVLIHLYVPDVDATFNQAVAAGATVVRPLENQFYGDRSGSLRDPFGHVWGVASHVEDVSDEEIKKRMAEVMAKQCANTNA